MKDYGSEFQLLRFLGYHKEDLDKAIKKQTGIPENTKLEWFDFNYGNSTKKADTEIQGFDFLPDEEKNRIEPDWQIKSNWQSWDAVFKADDTYYIIEAKAHRNEFHSKCGATDKNSENAISKLMKDTISKEFNIASNVNFLDPYYQFANRLATTIFLNQHCIKTKLIYLLFINGYTKNKGNSTKIYPKECFESEIENEYNALGLKGVDLSQYVSNVFIDAKTGESL